MESRVPARLTVAQGRSFGLKTGIMFIALGVVVSKFSDQKVGAALIVLGVLLLLGGLVVPGKMGPVFQAWMAFALLLSRVTTPLFLGVVYFGVLTPVGVLRRTLGRNPLTNVPQGDSYWRPKEPSAQTGDRMVRPY